MVSFYVGGAIKEKETMVGKGPERETGGMLDDNDRVLRIG